MGRLSSWVLSGVLVYAGPALAAPVPCDRQTTAQQADKGAAKPAEAKGPQEHRPWKYWQGDSQKEIGINAQQSAKIEQIFQNVMPKLEATKKKLDVLEGALTQMIKASNVDLDAFKQQLDQVNSTRADLYKTRMVQLYEMRSVLTADQRLKLQAILDRWEAAHRKAPDSRR